MVDEMKEYICSDRDSCSNKRCLYRKNHSNHGSTWGCEPFPCYFLGLEITQHCGPVNKEGIMEDNRKGTWEDVTKKCSVQWNSYSAGSYAGVWHDRAAIAWLGKIPAVVPNPNYRVTFPDGIGELHSGYLKVEHFTPDPEPVIAYKAVIEVDGEWVSTWAGGRRAAADQERLFYAVGQIVTATKGPGVACFRELESAHEAYPAEGKGSGTSIPRNDGRLGILEVQTIGEGTLPFNFHDAESRGAYCYPSVKVLSVAWEEEKKEEWVDVTRECKLELWAEGGGYNINVRHNNKWVFFLGPETSDPKTTGYRVTFPQGGTKDVHTGTFKIEKRND